MRPTAWEYYASRRRNPRASDASPFNQTGPVKLTLFVHNSADQVSSQQDSGPHQDNAERIVGRNFEHCSRSHLKEPQAGLLRTGARARAGYAVQRRATPITQSTCDANQPFLSFINVTGAEAALLANVRRRLCG